jgi:hypothetical protein
LYPLGIHSDIEACSFQWDNVYKDHAGIRYLQSSGSDLFPRISQQQVNGLSYDYIFILISLL